MAAPSESTRALLAAVLGDAAPADPEPRAPSLVALVGPRAGDRLALRDGAVLGRGRGADLRLRDGLASRSHARFTRAGPGWRVHDLGSKNGLRVNGRPAAPGGAALGPGDRLAVGESVLVFEAPPLLPPPPPPSPPGAPAPAGRRPALVAAAALLACALALAAVAG